MGAGSEITDTVRLWWFATHHRVRVGFVTRARTFLWSRPEGGGLDDLREKIDERLRAERGEPGERGEGGRRG